MSNVLVGHEVRRADEPHGEVGVVVRRFTAPMPDILDMPEIERAHALNVWRGLPAQITVFWPGGDLVPSRTEYLLASEVVHAHPGQTYRAGDFGFPIAAIETDGYCDLIMRHPNGKQAARIEWLDEPKTDLGDPGQHRARLHQLIDAYCDEIERLRQAELAARQLVAAE